MIPDITHPHYRQFIGDWKKWRLAYFGGTDFIDEYLQKFGARETTRDFLARKNMTYCPAFAKSAVDEIKNSIFQRTADVTREGGSDTYIRASRGELGGVDLMHSTMNSFIGQQVMPEMLVMKKVGVYVDMPPLTGETLADKGDMHPYLYTYGAEDIRSWVWDERASSNLFKSILLRDWTGQYDERTGLPLDLICRYRYVYIGEDGYVRVEYYDEMGSPVDWEGNVLPEITPIRLELTKIPFVLGELPHSLMEDIAGIQVALLNMASADISYATKANFPFYTEQFDSFGASKSFRPAGRGDTTLGNEGAGQGESKTAQTAQASEIRVGIQAGRAYPKGLERPGFIHPSPEPLRVSMEKQQQMKAELRQLVHLSVANLNPKLASAESKTMDERSLENGLSAIGMVLEQVERGIAQFWADYEGTEPSTIRYPQNWSIQTESERRTEADELSKLMPMVPSKTYQKEVAKQIAKTMVGHRVSAETWEQIQKEIDDAKVMTADPIAITADVINGLVSHDTASMARGYPEGEAEKAKKDHIERLAAIAIAQTPGMGAGAGARGLPGDPGAGAAEKRNAADTTQDPVPQDKSRGKAASVTKPGTSPFSMGGS